MRLSQLGAMEAEVFFSFLTFLSLSILLVLVVAFDPTSFSAKFFGVISITLAYISLIAFVCGGVKR